MKKKSLYGQIMMVRPEWIEEMHKPVVFHIDELALYYWSSEKTDWNIGKGDFPNLAPPYPNFWMEYQMPKDVPLCTEEGDLVIEEEEHYAAHFEGMDLQKDIERNDAERLVIGDKVVADNVRWLLKFQLYIFKPEKYKFPARADIRFMIALDDTGAAVPVWGDESQPMLVEFGDDLIEDMNDIKIRRQIVDGVFAIVHPMMLAISFLHTKNTEIISSDDAPLSKSARRHAGKNRVEPSYTFHTLNILPLREVLRREGMENSAGTGIAKAAHLRRGNFADYREGRGLFGKYHGIFWRDSTFVGNKEVGQSDKDYNVRAPKESEDGGQG